MAGGANGLLGRRYQPELLGMVFLHRHELPRRLAAEGHPGGLGPARGLFPPRNLPKRNVRALRLAPSAREEEGSFGGHN